MDNVTIKILDEREDVTKPPLDPNQFDFESVIEAANIDATPENPLSIEVVVRSIELGPNGEKFPTSFSHPRPTFEHKKVKITDSKTGKVHKIHQEQPGEPDMTQWHLHLQLTPKDEASFGTLKAISRAISREIFAMSCFRAYGLMIEAVMSAEEYKTQSTKFADDAPWAVK